MAGHEFLESIERNFLKAVQFLRKNGEESAISEELANQIIDSDSDAFEMLK